MAQTTDIEERRMLPELLKHFGLPLIGVEVGVAGGSFSQELLQAGLEKIYCVDNWGYIPNVTGDGNFPQDFHDNSFKEYQERFSGEYKDRVVTLKGLSSEMHKNIPDNSLGLVYHDGCHEQETVLQDIYYYIPKLVSGGIMAFHDYFNEGYGVKKAVDEYVAKNELILNTIPEEHLNSATVWFKKN